MDCCERELEDGQRGNHHQQNQNPFPKQYCDRDFIRGELNHHCSKRNEYDFLDGRGEWEIEWSLDSDATIQAARESSLFVTGGGN
jgi:hypothetical protein